jgi:hypothetical protein
VETERYKMMKGAGGGGGVWGDGSIFVLYYNFYD